MTVCVYPTDGNWISILHENQVENNVNFWRGDTRAIHLMPGTCFYFKIRGSMRIAGRGYFREEKTMLISDAWKLFGLGNGVTSKEQLEERAREVLKIEGDEISCLIFDGVEILEEEDRPEISTRDFPKSIMGRKDFEEHEIQYIMDVFDSSSVDPLLAVGEGLANANREFDPKDIASSRKSVLSSISVRAGQSKFRTELLIAYNGKCCITGEQEVDVLEAAHIHPYLGEDTNDLQNGIIVRSDWHTIFDLGHWTVGDDFDIIISRHVKSRNYREYAGKQIFLPSEAKLRPSKRALKFHREQIFKP
jgi:putative restriction endonuclease